jgi:hypothetical protein
MPRALWTVDTTKDQSLDAAPVRASLCCTPAYADEPRQARGSRPDGTWSPWAAHQATPTVVVTATPESGPPVDAATGAHLDDVATVTPVGRDGWAAASET